MYRIPNRIFVGGIPQMVSQDELRDYFSHFGHVKDARIITDPRGNSRGYGFVTYENESDASKVLSLKEEDLVFKDSKLNIGHAFRKKNNFPGQSGHQGPGHHHHQSNNFGHHHQMSQFGGMSNSHHQMSNQMNSNYMDSQLGLQHGLQQSGFGQNHMNLSQMNGHLGMSGLNGMNNFNHMAGLSGMSAISGMNMN